MRIALVHNFHSGATPSGENVVVQAEKEALERAGHRVEVVRIDNDEMASRPLTRVRAAVTVATGRGPSPLDRTEADPEVVHVHNLFPYFGRRWAAGCEVPVVTTLHSYRPMCASGYLYRQGQVCTRCLDGKRWSGVRFGCYRDSALASLPLVLANRVEHNDVIMGAATNLVLSERALGIFRAAGVPESRLTLARHFLPDSLAAGAPGESGTGWLCVSRLTPEKGVDRLVEHWPAERGLTIVGDGPLRPDILRAASGKRITLTGNLPRAQVLELMGASFGLVAPSLWYETFGLTYMEALSAGLPVLAFRPNVIAEKVAQEGTGIVARWGDLSAALREADSRFDALRNGCRRTFEQVYRERVWVERRTALYERLVR